MKLISKDLAYSAILGMEILQQDEMAQQFVKDGNRVKAARTDYKESAKVFGKVACALEVRLNAGIQAKTFAPNKSLNEFIESICGQKPPTHAMTLKNTFGGYVLTGFITEEAYDLNSNNCLELAGRILTAVNGDLTHEAVGLATTQLKERGDKEAQNLRDILDSVKPASKMTVEQALEAMTEICASGHVAACLAQLPDETMKMVEAEQKITYIATAHVIARLDSKLGDVADAWATEAGDAWKAPAVKITDAGVPRETAPAETPAPVAETETAEVAA